MIARRVRTDRRWDPIALGARTGHLWHSGARRIAGVGEPLGVPVDVFAAQDSSGGDGPGTTALLTQAFDPSAQAQLWVTPITLVGDGQQQWLEVTDPSCSLADAEALVDEVMARPPRIARPNTITVGSERSAEQWRDDVVAPVIDRIRSGEVDKVVLARELLVDADRDLDAGAVVGRLARRFPTVYLFCVDGFVGASPELLVSRSGEVVAAHPLAGTAPRFSDPEVDAATARDLLTSTKDQWEHRLTIEWFLDNLLPFCSYVDAEPEPSIVTLPNVHHLGTRVEGRLSQPAVSILELVEALHPTPALGGAPQADALRIIDEVEGFDRGRYGGPVGWIDTDGNGEIAVGIRSAQINGTSGRVWAGVGVVADSDPDSELAETRSKFQAVLGSLIEL